MIPALGLICGGLADTDRPATLVGVGKTRGQGALNIGTGEPECQIRVGSHAALKTPGEACESGGPVIGLGCRREGLLMVNFSEDEKGHTRFTA